jgi:S1-C subfamily serine protease
VSEALSQQTGQDRGLMVLRLAEGGPAEAAGIVAGDIVLAVGDLAATHPGRIARSLGPESVGREEVVRLARAGSPLTVTVKITARPTA